METMDDLDLKRNNGLYVAYSSIIYDHVCELKSKRTPLWQHQISGSEIRTFLEVS